MKPAPAKRSQLLFISSIFLACVHACATPTFTEGVTVADGFNIGFLNRYDRVTAADFDGDGLEDLAYNTGTGDIYWIRNRGGVFDAPVQILNRSDSMYQIRSADMDGDGDQDLVFQTADEIIMVMKNKGDGTFGEATAWNWKYNTYLSDFQLEDFDGDGDVDILMVNEGSEIWYSKNDGTGAADEDCFFSPVHGAWFCTLKHVHILSYVNETTVPIRHPQWSAAGDFDGNGFPDVVIGSTSAFSDARSGALDVSRNDGLGGFVLHDFTTLQIQEMGVLRGGNGALLLPYDPIYVYSLKAAAIDNQPGDEVIATAWMRVPDELDPSSFEEWQTFEGLFYWTRPGGTLDGSGDFERRRIGPMTYDSMRYFDVADFDQDGDKDVVGLWDYTLAVMENDGAGGFPAANGVEVDINVTIMTLITADLDGDTKEDMILYAYDGGSAEIRVYYNTSGTPTPFQAWIRTNYVQLSVLDQMPGADPDGDGNDNEMEFEDGTDPTNAFSFTPHLILDTGAGTVTRSPNKAVYSVGDVVTLTPNPPVGYFFMGWTGEVFSMEESLTVTLERSVTLQAHFFPDFGGPVENSGLLWRTGGAAPWTATSSKAKAGGDSLMSGTITHNEESWVESTVRGPGTIRFWWWVSTDFEDWGEFLIDGVVRRGSAGPNVQWFQEEIYISEQGEHVLRWRYSRDGSGSYGSNRVWLDGVEWIPDEPSFVDWAAATGLWQDIAYASFDGDGNGIADVFDYGLDLPAARPSAGMPSLVPAEVPGGISGLRFRLPIDWRPDRVLRVKASKSLKPGSWQVIATKEGEDSWFGPASVDEVFQADGSAEVTVWSPWSITTEPNLFLTLEAGVRD